MQIDVDVIELKDTNFNNGKLMGACFKNSMQYIDIIQQITRNSNTQHGIRQFENFAPELLQELGGIAESLNIPLKESVKLFSGYDIHFPDMGCTTLIKNGFYARNYDFSPELYDKKLVFTKPENGYASVGFSHLLIGRLDGINEKGLVIGLHFVNNTPNKEGFLATTIVRMVLDQCSTAEEAVELIKSVPHGYCYNYSIIDKKGRSVIVEAGPHQQIARAANFLVCTNQFESEKMKTMNRHGTNSEERKRQILNDQTIFTTPIEAYQYFNHTNSPLFFKDYLQYFGTLHTVVYCPEKLQTIIGIGGNSKPLIFSLQSWMDGEVVPSKKISGVLPGNGQDILSHF